MAAPAPAAAGDDSGGGEPAVKRTPWWAYAMVCFAICCMSWGGPLFGLMVDTPVAMRVAWRLSIAATLQLAGLAADWRRADATLRARWVASLPLLALNGVILAAHFISFAGSVELTSFTNSMLLVSTVPTVFVLTGLASWGLGAWLRRRVGTPAPAAVVDAELPAAAPPPAPARAVAGIDANATRPPPLGALGSVSTLGSSSAAAFTSSRQLLSSVSIHDTTTATATDTPAALRELSTSSWHEDEAATAAATVSAMPPPFKPASAAAHATPPAARRRLSWDARLLGWLRGSSTHPQAPLPPMLYEVVGTAVATAGMAALVLLSAAEGAAAAAAAAASPDAAPAPAASRYIRPASPTGDVIALVSAACMAAYLAIGRSVRPWMPIWMYMCPTLWTAAVLAAAVSLTFEPGTSVAGDDDAALFGWLFSGRSAVIALSAGIVPTILGHAVANAALTWVSPLVISVMSLAQAVIGGLYAYGLGVTGAPSVVTLAAGPVIIGGIALVVTGSRTSPCPLPPPAELLAAVAGCGSGKVDTGGTASSSASAPSLASRVDEDAAAGAPAGGSSGRTPYALTSAVSIAVPGGSDGDDGSAAPQPAAPFDVRPAR